MVFGAKMAKVYGQIKLMTINHGSFLWAEEMLFRWICVLVIAQEITKHASET